MGKGEVIKFLSSIGVDTRFVSVMEDSILINNLRFSRFSRKREELFKKYYPNMKVVRSKIFQMICSRVSRVLSNELKPHQRILIKEGDDPLSYTLYAVLEPYTRKYGVRLVTRQGFDLIACPLTLDHIIADAIEKMINGKLISGPPLEDRKGRLLYPLSKVPVAWIERWLGVGPIKVTRDDVVQEFIGFFEEVLPQFRENMLKSLEYIRGDKGFI
ncbi:hypothetical protein [Methanothermobacter tenebrarum]|uniref:Uncharacterized protein n=1 Tax=Methanothermobacter tenebrarum TaxID=680118 RepID=A0A328PC79_9EURY|nr:hypothetical protein [Methanothermobacter tenebrarum]NPV64529.1 hypothetical protein [Methanobacteriaceae archaeon]RAO78761.1 hypothetical protein DPC56_06545 [Methanothermobacter tenebrarum]